MLLCNKISKTYCVDFFKKKPLLALNNVNLHVKKNEVFGIIGPNGAGKSTILKILMGFVKPDTGEALLNNHPSSTHVSREIVGYLPEHPSLYPNLTPEEHLRFSTRISSSSKKTDESRISEVLKIVDLVQHAKTPIKRFSKGMAQRAALANALVTNPKILILDEPMSGLDPFGRQTVLDIIATFNKRGTTILFCSHILTDVERICDRIAIMNKGSIVSEITPSELQSQFTPSGNRNNKSPLESFFFNAILETEA